MTEEISVQTGERGISGDNVKRQKRYMEYYRMIQKWPPFKKTTTYLQIALKFEWPQKNI